MTDIVNKLPENFFSLSPEDAFSILPLPQSPRKIPKSPFKAEILISSSNDSVIKRIILIMVRFLQIIAFAFFLYQQIPMLDSEDLLRAAMAIIAAGCFSLGLKNGVQGLLTLFPNSQLISGDRGRCESEIDILRHQLLMAQQKFQSKTDDKDLQKESLDLTRCTEQTLIQILNTDKLELMRALAKVKAAPTCTISYKKVLDPKQISFLNTNPKAIYEYDTLSNWIGRFPTCPTTRKMADLIIAPHCKTEQSSDFKSEQMFNRNQHGLEKEVRHQMQSYLNKESKERRRAICEVNREFGDDINYLTVN